ncbi:hypothetical protein [Priestia filamentosa]|uniref:hypothetical protein n=1 Tax=Priestia filamentosa TaxID=1402861 RepID=UPI000A08EC26|nr:hypothetical protein [Priestia filamentosa]MDT3765835.1 hypothetical protein [Priestia filamentosa]OXS65279.1 hypothetical protein B1B01_23365 [Priestia filamentosa]SMF70019.1 hypothetical protein SAMN06296056_11168 [Priestia filamentosa]
MSIPYRRYFKRNRPNIKQEEEVPIYSSLKDASVVVLILTGLTYLLGFAFKQGYLFYYGIHDLMLNNIEIYYIANSFISIFFLITAFIALYSFIKIIFSSLRDEGFVYQFFVKMFFTSYASLGLLWYTFNKEISDTASWTIYILIGIIGILDWLLGNKSVLYRNIVNPIKKPLLKFIIFVKTDKRWKSTILIPSIVIVLFIFYRHGQTQAAQRENYLIINNKSVNLAVIIQSGDNVLVAPVDLSKKVLTPNYRIIELKSSLDKQIVLKSIHIKGGLKVQKPVVK